MRQHREEARTCAQGDTLDVANRRAAMIRAWWKKQGRDDVEVIVCHVPNADRMADDRIWLTRIVTPVSCVRRSA